MLLPRTAHSLLTAFTFATSVVAMACSSESDSKSSGSGNGNDYVPFDLILHEMAISTAPTLIRPDGTEVEPIDRRPFELGVHSDGHFYVTFIIDAPPVGDDEINYGVDVALMLRDAPASYTAKLGEVTYDTEVAGDTAVVNFNEYQTVTSTGASGTVNLESYDVVEAASGSPYDAKLSLRLGFDHLAFTTKDGTWVVDGSLALTGAPGGIDAGTSPGDDGGGGAGCFSGTWKTPACGGARLQQLTFGSGTGSYVNPDCNGICTDLIFPFEYTVSTDSVTLHYTDPPQPTCTGISNPPKLEKPATDDTFTFTCEGGSLVTTTATGTTTYTR